MNKKPLPDKLLTEVELELMVILWRLEEASVRDVLQAILANRQVAYTSVATIIRILEQKGYLVSHKAGKSFRYRPVISKSEYENLSLDRMVSRLFDDAPLSMVARLIEKIKPDDKALAKLRTMLDEEGSK
jgi:predicted transcriptional regulator